MKTQEQIKNEIKILSETFYEKVLGYRRHLHSIPELAFEEYKTASFIATALSEMGIAFQQGVAHTGIVALIKPENAGKGTIALRSDMDALGLTENHETEYKSTHPGIMHACGHDVHMASLLGTAAILKQLENELPGTVKLIFQPSEEKYPGGASVMIKEGVLKNPDPFCIVGQHVLPTLASGKIGLKPGKYMASTDEIYITIHGKGGHAATPELNIDPVLISAHIIVGLQQLVSRFANPGVPSVLSFGRVTANGRTNVIPDSVVIEGTFRTYNEVWRAEAHEKIIQLATKMAESMGGTADVFIDKGYPFLVNDVELTRNIRTHAIDYLGAENVVDLDLRMTAEDFAYYSQLVPGCFYRLGTQTDGKAVTNLHTSNFEIDETCLKTGMGLMAWIAFKSLVEKA